MDIREALERETPYDWLSWSLALWCQAHRTGSPTKLTRAFHPLAAPEERERPEAIIGELKRDAPEQLRHVKKAVIDLIRDWRPQTDEYDTLVELLRIARRLDPPGVTSALDELLGTRIPLVRGSPIVDEIINLALYILQSTADRADTLPVVRTIRRSPHYKAEMVTRLVLASVGFRRSDWPEAFLAWREDLEQYRRSSPEDAARRLTALFGSISMPEVAASAHLLIAGQRLDWLGRIVFEGSPQVLALTDKRGIILTTLFREDARGHPIDPGTFEALREQRRGTFANTMLINTAERIHKMEADQLSSWHATNAPHSRPH